VLKEPDRDAEAKSYMWVFIGGHVSKKAVVFHYNVSRAHTVIEGAPQAHKEVYQDEKLRACA
ncbi:MAG: hypothetical protein O3A05_10630, partial [Proteobacteria bacterium]|nr:hypothetical protein [Pseudomonadota bacterium]